MREDFFKEEIICDYKVTEKMKRVWAVQLDLLEKFMDVCDRNGLKYFATYGTLLGAVRHKGFIPWDDDIDITMPRKDFDKLKLIAENEFEYPYFFQTPENDPENFTAGGCRLRNSNTTYIEFLNLGHFCNNGCYIDITALDGVFDDRQQRSKQLKKIDFYKSLLYAKVYGDNFYELFNYTAQEWEFYRILAKFFPHNWLCKKFNEACSKCSVDNTKQVGIYTQKNGYYEYRFFEKDIFEQTVLLEFEHMLIPVPRKYDLFISTVWENGMDLPPENERKPRHEGFFETNIPYKEYVLPKYTDLFNDIKGKDIIIFGAGKMLEYYMEKHGQKYSPKVVIDNDPNKWGTIKNGVPVQSPQELPMLLQGNERIIIVNIYYREIGEQLERMGITEYYVYLQGRKYG